MKEHTSTRKEKRFVLLTLLTAGGLCRTGVLVCSPAQGAHRANSPARTDDPGRPGRFEYSRLDALCTLPGIGEKKARAILDYRRQNGAFRHVEDAVYVPGITSRIVESWQNLAYVS